MGQANFRLDEVLACADGHGFHPAVQPHYPRPPLREQSGIDNAATPTFRRGSAAVPSEPPNMSRSYLLLPFAAAVIFALSTLCYKRALKEGASLSSVFALTNLALSFVFLPLLVAAPSPIPWDRWFHPATAGALFFLGHLCHFLALRRGDVSVVTPIMGAKVILVALLAAGLFDARLSPGDWWAAVLAGAGVILMGVSDSRPEGNSTATILLALASCLAFALCDVWIQQWAAPFGIWGFVAILFLTVGCGGLLAMPLFRGQPSRLPPATRKWLAAGIGLTALQALLISTSIGIWRDATGVNVVYGLRGVWGVALVWWIGHRMGITERREAGTTRMSWRLFSAFLVVLGVVLTALS